MTFRQSVTITREKIPLEKTFTDKLSHLFSYCFKYIQPLLKVEGSDCQLFSRLLFLFMIALSCDCFSIYGLKYWATLYTHFRHLLSCIATDNWLKNFTLSTFFSIELILLNFFRSIATTNLILKLVLTKRHKIFLCVKRNIPLGLCFEPSVLPFPQKPQMVWIIILLRKTALQNMMLPSSVNFVTEKFHTFPLYVNKKTLSTALLIKQQTWIPMISWAKLMIRIWKCSYVHVTISTSILN